MDTSYYISWLGECAFGVTNSAPTVLAPAPVVFQPTDLSNCVLWLDANNPLTITDISGSVSSWSNQGTLGGTFDALSNAPITGSNTLNGLNIINFTSGSQLFWTEAIDDQEKTGFLVFTVKSDLSLELVPYVDCFSTAAETELQFGVNWDSNTSNYNYVACLSGQWCNIGENATNPLNTPQLFSFRMTTDLSNNFISLGTSNLTLTANNSNLYFAGSNVQYWINRSDGTAQDVAEMVVYNRALSDGEVSQVQSYLLTKWLP